MLLDDGGQADLSDLAADVVTAGYAFNGDREEKGAKRRVVIPGMQAAP